MSEQIDYSKYDGNNLLESGWYTCRVKAEVRPADEKVDHDVLNLSYVVLDGPYRGRYVPGFHSIDPTPTMFNNERKEGYERRRNENRDNIQALYKATHVGEKVGGATLDTIAAAVAGKDVDVLIVRTAESRQLEGTFLREGDVVPPEKADLVKVYPPKNKVKSFAEPRSRAGKTKKSASAEVAETGGKTTMPSTF